MKDKFVLTRGMLILIILIILIILGIVFGVKVIIKNSDEKYIEYETELEEETKNYYKIYYLNEGKELSKNEEKKITMKTLINNGMIFDTQDVVKECTGFVIMRSEMSEENMDIYDINYKAYIKCGNKYTSPGYDAY